MNKNPETSFDWKMGLCYPLSTSWERILVFKLKNIFEIEIDVRQFACEVHLFYVYA
jgi:hypothetical protein